MAQRDQPWFTREILKDPRKRAQTKTVTTARDVRKMEGNPLKTDKGPVAGNYPSMQDYPRGLRPILIRPG